MRIGLHIGIVYSLKIACIILSTGLFSTAHSQGFNYGPQGPLGTLQPESCTSLSDGQYVCPGQVAFETEEGWVVISKAEYEERISDAVPLSPIEIKEVEPLPQMGIGDWLGAIGAIVGVFQSPEYSPMEAVRALRIKRKEARKLRKWMKKEWITSTDYIELIEEMYSIDLSTEQKK